MPATRSTKATHRGETISFAELQCRYPPTDPQTVKLVDPYFNHPKIKYALKSGDSAWDQVAKPTADVLERLKPRVPWNYQRETGKSVKMPLPRRMSCNNPLRQAAPQRELRPHLPRLTQSNLNLMRKSTPYTYKDR